MFTSGPETINLFYFLQMDVSCAIHKQPSKYFCCSCNSRLCDECWVSNHSEHSVQLVAIWRKQKLKEIVNEKALDNAVEKLETRWQNLKGLSFNLKLLSSDIDNLLLETADMLQKVQKLKTPDNCNYQDLNDGQFQKLLTCFENDSSGTTNEPYSVVESRLLQLSKFAIGLKNSYSKDNASTDTNNGAKNRTNVKKTVTKSAQKITQPLSSQMLELSWDLDHLRTVKTGTSRPSEFQIKNGAKWHISVSRNMKEGSKNLLMYSFTLNFLILNAKEFADIFGKNFSICFKLVNLKNKEKSHTRNVKWKAPNISENFSYSVTAENMIESGQYLNPENNYLYNERHQINCVVMKL